MIRFAIIGCGRIAQRYLEIFSRGLVNQAVLTAVCDTNLDRASAAGAKAAVPHFSDMHEMMRQRGAEIDAIIILTESGNHAPHLLELTQYKKHFVVEKPMALRLDHADAMIASCDSANAKLFVVKQNRFNVPIQRLRTALDEGRFGRIVMGTVRVRWCRRQEYYSQDSWRGTWRLDGGVFANQASHHVDLLEWMLGEPVSVYARTRTALAKIEVEDTGVAIIQFRSGAIGVIEATTAARPIDLEGSLSILGEHGTVEVGGFAVNQIRHWRFADPRPEDANVIKDFSENPPNVYGYGHTAYLNQVVKSILGDSPALVDGLEGRKSLELINAIYESAETGREIAMRFSPSRCRLGIA